MRHTSRLRQPVATPGDAGAAVAGAAFHSLIAAQDWQRLPVAVQRRFGHDLAPGESAVYIGEVAATEMTMVGWAWAQLLRIVGAPLPLKALAHTASMVVVTADSAAQCWTRIYHEPGRLPQVIRSIKSFTGPTGLEERVGAGVSMALNVAVESRALIFRSAGYQWRCGRLLWSIPLWLTPGRMEVQHREEREGRFSFTLTVTHPWCGRIIHQIAYFRDGTR